MQDHPGAPGTARQGSTRTVVPAACGGAAAPMAPGLDHPLTTAARLPGQDRPCAVPPAPDHDRSRARHTKAPGHERPPVAQRAARHDCPRATPQAPGHDVPLATTARAPGYGRPRAAPRVPVPDRFRPAQKVPGHGRPPVALSSAAGHDRPRATPQAPGHDVPLATTVTAPGYGRPRAAQLRAGPPLVPPRAYGAAGSRTGARRHVCAYRHRSRAGPREPAAPGPSIPYHRHSRQPHLPALPPKRREPPRPALPLHHPSHASTHHGSNRGASLTTDGRRCASCHPGTAPPVTHHHGHGPPPPTPLPRPAPARLPKTYPCQRRGGQRGNRPLLLFRESIRTATVSPFPEGRGLGVGPHLPTDHQPPLTE